MTLVILVPFLMMLLLGRDFVTSLYHSKVTIVYSHQRKDDSGQSRTYRKQLIREEWNLVHTEISERDDLGQILAIPHLEYPPIHQSGQVVDCAEHIGLANPARWALSLSEFTKGIAVASHGILRNLHLFLEVRFFSIYLNSFFIHIKPPFGNRTEFHY